MGMVVSCPGCGMKYSLDESLAGKLLRCKGCELVFRASGGSTGAGAGARASTGKPAAGGGGRARPQPGASAKPAARGDASWLEDGADGDELSGVVPSPRRGARSAPASESGISTNLLIGLGAGAGALILLLIALVVFNRGGAPARKPKGEQPVAEEKEAPGLGERLVNAVTGHDPLTDPSGYPELGPLLPPLLPPPPLRDISAHERQARAMIAAIDRMNGILASIHDVSSLKSAGEQLQTLSQQSGNDLRQNSPPFQLTPAEDAELSRRVAGEMRRVMQRAQQESQRITSLPGLGIAGSRLSMLITQLSFPVEQSLKRAEGFKARTGPAPYVEVFIQGHDPDESTYFWRKLLEMLGGEKGIQGGSQGTKNRVSFRVWPVDDADLFARSIAFGKARVKGRQIFVQADPVPTAEIAAAKAAQKKEQDDRDAAFKAAFNHENPNDPKPPADADDVTRALFALRSSDSGKRSEGVKRLTIMTPRDDRREEVHKQLATLLEDPNGFFVNDVMKAMARWRTEGTVPALIKVLDRPEFGVRWEAEELLGKLGDPKAAGPLADHLKEDGIKVEPALRALGPAAEPALIALLRNPDSRVRASACDLLKDIGGKDTLEAMLALPADPDFGVQVAARNAMQAIRGRVGPVTMPRKNGGATKGKGGRSG